LIILAQKHPKFIISIIIILLVTYNIPTNWDVTNFADGFSNGLEQSHIKIGKILGNEKYYNNRNNKFRVFLC
jgi:hypothetical protein